MKRRNPFGNLDDSELPNEKEQTAGHARENEYSSSVPMMGGGFQDADTKREARTFKLAWYPGTEPSVKNIESAECSSTTLVGRKAYIIGGLASSKSPVYFQYDVDEDKFTNLETSGMGPNSIAYHTAIHLNNKVYVFGGDVGVGSSSSKMTSSEIWSLDLATKEWQKLKPLKFIEARKHHAACEFGPYMLVSGGLAEDTSVPFKDFHAYSTGTFG